MYVDIFSHLTLSLSSPVYSQSFEARCGVNWYQDFLFQFTTTNNNNHNNNILLKLTWLFPCMQSKNMFLLSCRFISICICVLIESIVFDSWQSIKKEFHQEAKRGKKERGMAQTKHPKVDATSVWCTLTVRDRDLLDIDVIFLFHCQGTFSKTLNRRMAADMETWSLLRLR